MKINKENVKERLAHVPENKRSHIYDATIVLEFLAATFMPTKFFLPETFKPTPGQPLGPKSMKALAKEHNFKMTELYDLYLLYREEKDYTMKIESRYIFGIIIRNMRYYKNSWEFVTYRVGTAQIWHVGPLQLRSDVPAETRNKFAAKEHEKTVDEITVEADPVTNEEDVAEMADDMVYVPDPSSFFPIKPMDRFVEAHSTEEAGLLGSVSDGELGKKNDEDRFVEATSSRFKESVYEPEHTDLGEL